MLYYSYIHTKCKINVTKLNPLILVTSGGSRQEFMKRLCLSQCYESTKHECAVVQMLVQK